jgi:nitroreductase
MDTYDAIARRTSTRSYRPDPVPRHIIERLLAAAVRAPNHKLTEPWRFAVLTGDSKRRYAELRRAHRVKRFDDPASPEARSAGEKALREHLSTPAFIVVLCSLSEDAVRREEDYGATMMAIENLLVAASADGIGTILRTGGIMADPEVRGLAGAREHERIVGIVSLGYLATAPEPTPRRKPLADLVTWLD